eukprot:4806179-Alexandrium_andersonii.AAC.1
MLDDPASCKKVLADELPCRRGSRWVSMCLKASVTFSASRDPAVSTLRFCSPCWESRAPSSRSMPRVEASSWM